MPAVVVPAPLGDTTLSVSTPTQPTGPTPCPTSSTVKTPAATIPTWPSPSLPLGLPMLSVHTGATPASAMDMTSPMTLSTLEPGTLTPIIHYTTMWESSHGQSAAVHGETACQSRPFWR